MHFKELLAELRVTRDLSQSDVARAAGVDRSRVSEWVRGLGLPSPQSLESLANAYGLDLDHLMYVCGYRAAPPTDPVDPFTSEVVALSRQIDKQDQPLVTRLLRAWAVPPTTPTHARRRRDPHARRYKAEHRKLTRPDDDESPEPPDSRYSEYYPRVDSEIAGIMRDLAPLSRRAAVA